MLGAKQMIVAGIAALAMAMAAAAPPDGKGPPEGKGPGGGGGGGSVDVYAEMVEIDRDINGVPILTEGLGPNDTWTWVRQPIMFGDRGDCPLNFSELDPVAPESIYTYLQVDARYIPFVDGEIPEEYGPCMTEAHLGRLSAVRSPAKVLDMALLELVTSLSLEGVTIGLDEAGRLQISYFDDVLDVEVVKTIDAPRENLAGFESLLEMAELSHPEVAGGAAVSGLPTRPDRSGDADQAALELMDRAAAMLGGASDKFGAVGLDEAMYISEILTMGSDMTAAAKAVFGEPFPAQVAQDRSQYFNFSKFEYDRAKTYAGEVCYLKVTTPDGPPQPGDTLPVDVIGQVVKEPILELLFPPLDDPNGYTGGLSDQVSYTGFIGENAWAFARAVDDARAVIYFVHEHPVPVELMEYCNIGLPEGQRYPHPTE